MANEPQSGSPLLLIVIVVAVIFFATRGGSNPDPVKPDPVKPTPDITEPKPVTANDAWEMLAYTVEKKLIGGEMQQHTDHILKIVDTLRASGTLPDVTRVEPWRAKRIEITDANRSDIAKTLRGK
jgi:hypothetical protein